MSGHKKCLSVALLSAVLLPAMASAADAPATFTPGTGGENRQNRRRLTWSPTREVLHLGEPEIAANTG